MQDIIRYLYNKYEVVLMNSMKEKLRDEDRRYERRLKDIYEENKLLSIKRKDNENKGLRYSLIERHSRVVDILTKAIYETCSRKRLVVDDFKKCFTIRDGSMYLFNETKKPSIKNINNNSDLILGELEDRNVSEEMFERLRSAINMLDEFGWVNSIGNDMLKYFGDIYIAYSPGQLVFLEPSLTEEKAIDKAQRYLAHDNGTPIYPEIKEGSSKWEKICRNRTHISHLIDSYHRGYLNTSDEMKILEEEYRELFCD